jgi:hypothetical protein
MRSMDFELTTAQARAVWRLRRRWPAREVLVHPRAWGVIVEVRAGGRTVALRTLDADGTEHQPAGLAPALAA